jgi:hypothetical protein
MGATCCWYEHQRSDASRARPEHLSTLRTAGGASPLRVGTRLSAHRWPLARSVRYQADGDIFCAHTEQRPNLAVLLTVETPCPPRKLDGQSEATRRERTAPARCGPSSFLVAITSACIARHSPARTGNPAGCNLRSCPRTAPRPAPATRAATACCAGLRATKRQRRRRPAAPRRARRRAQRYQACAR